MQKNDLSGDAGAISYLRKESLDIFNRLCSIGEDIDFVLQVRKAYPDTPFLPNLRCGSWYTDPKISAQVPAYFKSTDGHFNNWSFNLRRSNLHLLDLIMEGKGMILVDSTRSGKRIPDALSKTVPIWCAVINRAMLILHPESLANDSKAHSGWNTALYTPPSAVSMQEHSQIEQRLDGWAKSLANSSFSLPLLPLPLRPVWITPGTTTFPELPTNDKERKFYPVICVSASKRVETELERRPSGFSYVQGSGDDHELWGMGLTPELFWAHQEELLGAERESLPDLVASIVSKKEKIPSHMSLVPPPTPVTKADGRLVICAISEISEVDQEGEVAYLILTPSHDPSMTSNASTSKLYIPLTSGKKGQTEFLQSVLPRSMHFIREHLAAGKRVCVACESGKDSSVGVVLTALQLFFTDDGKLSSLDTQPSGSDTVKYVDKNSIRTRLEWIIASRPYANPSRTTLKRVNEFLLTPPSFRASRPS